MRRLGSDLSKGDMYQFYSLPQTYIGNHIETDTQNEIQLFYL